MTRRTLLILCALCFPLCPCPTAAAQPLDRLSGKVLTERGEPIKDADVRVEAIFGFAGSDFLGQRTFTARTNAKGEWALLAFKSGIWVFDASVPGQLPDAVALPFNLVVPAGQGMAGVVTAWHPILHPAPLPSGDVGQRLGELSLAYPGRSFDEHGAAHARGEEHDGGDATVGDVARVPEPLLDTLDRLEHAGSFTSQDAMLNIGSL